MVTWVGTAKLCMTCMVEKPSSDFYIADKQTGRLTRQCKMCKQKAHAQWLETHPSYMTEYKHANADNIKQKGRERWHKTVETHKDDPEWRERQRKIGRDKVVANPDLYRLKHKRHEQRKRANGDYTQREWEELLRRCGGKCAYCGVAEAETADHMIPLSRGGTNFISNILPACRPCNSSKGSKTPEEWDVWKRERVAASAAD